MLDLSLPSEVITVFETFRCCEFTTLNKQGVPVTWPVSAVYFPERGQFLITTSISFPQKVWNIRRNPKVALLFSDPTGSGLTNTPIILVQGSAKVSDEIVVLNEDMKRFWREPYRGSRGTYHTHACQAYDETDLAKARPPTAFYSLGPTETIGRSSKASMRGRAVG